MVAWLLWVFVALHLFLLDGVLGRVSTLIPETGLAIGLFCAVYARPMVLPALLLGAALPRSVLVEGSAALHLLALGVPVAVLLPLRSIFSRGSLLWPCLAAGFLSFIVPRLAGLLHRVSGEGVAVDPPSALQIFAAMCLVPVVTWVLRSLPPLSLFAEDRQ